MCRPGRNRWTNYREEILEARAPGLLLYDISGEGGTAKAVTDGEAMPGCRFWLSYGEESLRKEHGASTDKKVSARKT